MKTISKQSVKNGAIKGICHVMGGLYFVAQGAADALKHAEGAIVHKIDDNISAKNVRETRQAIYDRDLATIQLGVTIAQEKYIKAKHAVERKIDVMLHGPLPGNEEMLQHEMAQ